MISIILFKKELREYARSKKLLALLLIFAFFGIISPVTAYFTPDIMSYVAKSQNIKIEIPPPTFNDALFQYIKNISQMCIFVLILMTMGQITNEKEKGTAVFLLVKPVKRISFITAKFLSTFAMVTAATLVAALCAGFYTYVFFDFLPIKGFLAQNILILLYIWVICACTLMFGSLFKSQIPAGILTIALWLLFTLLGQFGPVASYSPDALIAGAGTFITTNLWPIKSIIVACCLIAGAYLTAVTVFNRWEPE